MQRRALWGSARAIGGSESPFEVAEGGETGARIDDTGIRELSLCRDRITLPCMNEFEDVMQDENQYT